MIGDRRFWTAHTLLFKRYVKPGETIVDSVAVPISPHARPARIVAQWRYIRTENFRNRERGIVKAIPHELIGQECVTMDGKICPTQRKTPSGYGH
jgi:hypothetical protein